MPKHDISGRGDIELLVDAFYAKATKDVLLGPIFIPIMQSGRWDEHVTRIYDFWHSLLLDEPKYQGNAFAPHAHMPLEQRHFDRWVALFHATVDAHFAGANADKAKLKSTEIAAIFLHKIHFLKK
ncbi:MAG: group III truncated hemoglobin [Cryomorphaceae bacterium]